MSKENNLTDFLTDIAVRLKDVNRDITGTSINPQDFSELIASKNTNYDSSNPYVVGYNNTSLVFGGEWKKDMFGNITIDGANSPSGYSLTNGKTILLLGKMSDNPQNKVTFTFKDNNFQDFSVRVKLFVESGICWFTGTTTDGEVKQYQTTIKNSATIEGMILFNCVDESFNYLFRPISDATGDDSDIAPRVVFDKFYTIY